MVKIAKNPWDSLNVPFCGQGLKVVQITQFIGNDNVEE